MKKKEKEESLFQNRLEELKFYRETMISNSFKLLGFFIIPILYIYKEQPHLRELVLIVGFSIYTLISWFSYNSEKYIDDEYAELEKIIKKNSLVKSNFNRPNTFKIMLFYRKKYK